MSDRVASTRPAGIRKATVVNKPAGVRLVWVGVVLLIILRQDFWFWDDPTLVWGALPVGLAWQVGISIAAAVLWYAATRVAWPKEEVFPAQPSAPSRSARGRGR